MDPLNLSDLRYVEARFEQAMQAGGANQSNPAFRPAALDCLRELKKLAGDVPQDYEWLLGLVDLAETLIDPADAPLTAECLRGRFRQMRLEGHR